MDSKSHIPLKNKELYQKLADIIMIAWELHKLRIKNGDTQFTGTIVNPGTEHLSEYMFIPKNGPPKNSIKCDCKF